MISEAQRAANHTYYVANREKAIGSSRTWRAANPERERENQHRARMANLDQRLESDRARYESDPAPAKRAAFNADARKRVQSPDLYVEDVDPQVVYERDHWTCGICLDPIDRTLPWYDQRSPSVDHVKDLRAGGEHGYANVQAAHLRCNLRKTRHKK